MNERESGGIIFTTIQKFKPEAGEMPVLTGRRNVIIIADEAHRSQYGLDAKTDIKTGDIKFGYAKYMRDALPNASYIGFTGTLIEFEDKSTPAVFGDYIDIYDMRRAVEDQATVKIYYENRIIKLDADVDVLKEMDEEEAALGLSRDEIAFYYALAKDGAVKEFFDDDTLKKIAQELTDAIRKNVTIDFNMRTQAQAAMRSIIRRLLKKYKYPPEHALEALNIVMKQVELMCANEAEELTYDGMLGYSMAADDLGGYGV